MLYDLVIKNGTMVTSGDQGRLDIGIKDGVIAALAPSIDPELATEVIDAQGGYVTPGGVDAHVHLAQEFNSGPSGGAGMCADDFESGSRSAICGGTTTLIAFAMQNRGDSSLLQVVENYHAEAMKTGSYCDWAYHVIISRPDMQMLKAELPVLVDQWGITSVKLFMTYAALQLSDYQLLDVMYEARKLSITTMIHAENGDLITWLTEKLEEKGMIDPGYHAESRPPIVETEATSRAIVLAEMIQNPILFVHVGSATAAKVIRDTQSRGYPVYAETCPQYLHLTWEDLKRFHSPQCFENAKMICSPPPGPGKSDQEALWTGLRNGTFTIYSSDHCPFRYDDVRGKAVGVLEHAASMADVTCPIDNEHVQEIVHGKTGHFKYVPNGCPGVETRLPLLFNYGVERGRITVERFVELTSTAPAKMYGLYPKKGALLPGLSDADLVIWYPPGRLDEFSLTNEHLHHDTDYTPYEGMRFGNWPRYTISKGKVVWKEGALLGSPTAGKYLKRAASQFTKAAVESIASDPARVATWLYQ